MFLVEEHRKVDIIIDFHEYLVDNKLLIKELAIMSLQPLSNGIYIDKHYLFRQPFSWSKLSRSQQIEYLYNYEVHGIPWELGHTDIAFQNSILRDSIIKAKKIFVLDTDKKQSLQKILGQINKPITCILNTYSNPISINYKTKCVHHENPDDHNCAYDNALKIKYWFSGNL
ncbi:putative Bracovirus particle protein MdBV-1-9 [Microplitis demolitor]